MQTEFFEWDDQKALCNVNIHGVDFGEASTVFEDPFAITIPDVLHSDEEDRSIRLGLSLLSRVLLSKASIFASSAQESPRRLRGFNMNQNANGDSKRTDDDMRPEYDFSRGLRGVHACRISKLSSDEALILIPPAARVEEK